MSASDSRIYKALRIQAFDIYNKRGPDKHAATSTFPDYCDAMAYAASSTENLADIAMRAVMLENCVKEWIIHHPDEVRVWLGDTK